MTTPRTVSIPLLTPSSCCPRIQGISLPISVYSLRELTNVTPAWNMCRQWTRLDFDSHAVESAALPTLGRKAPTGRLSEHAAQSERAVGTFRLWWYRGLSSHSAKLSRRPAFGPFLRIQPDLPGLPASRNPHGFGHSECGAWRAVMPFSLVILAGCERAERRLVGSGPTKRRAVPSAPVVGRTRHPRLGAAQQLSVAV